MLLHIFWSCDKLRGFWSQMRTIIKQMMSCYLGEERARYLLHLWHLPRHRYKKMMMVSLDCGKGVHSCHLETGAHLNDHTVFL